MKNPRLAEALSGARAVMPLVIGAAPFGIIFGTLAQSSGLSMGGTIAFSAVVFAGSAQFVALGLVSAGTAVPLIVLTTLVVNLRHLLYSASLVPHVRHLSSFWKALISFWLVDETFAAAIGRFQKSDSSSYKHWYYFGAGLLMYLNWQLWTVVGLTVGQMIPDATRWGLDFAMVATFIGMVVPYVTNRPMVATVLVAAGVAAITYGLPHKFGIIVAAIAGVAAGLIVEKNTGSHRPTSLQK